MIFTVGVGQRAGARAQPCERHRRNNCRKGHLCEYSHDERIMQRRMNLSTKIRRARWVTTALTRTTGGITLVFDTTHLTTARMIDASSLMNL
uniref:C3H1-type domain-containing protein n=1 Tax=Chromera velia CCMP2878 TaxID=1169474 RepID=A0A0G4HY25_9ALVE|eukprot:Cvel_1516.t1-p1 / transcript=Cvel_1516.t1 / gene=Cvel_1516 / organism=Chromera_velia_CCMP2878 / gene_product=hypothetical protein / transcript_product=hypothetical protein / location=Cvel_scaffold53:106374-107737(-) / protein_length=91 / sequence_SO=supercontig / SO=protein_coding / is_pseudo=false